MKTIPPKAQGSADIILFTPIGEVSPRIGGLAAGREA